MNLDEAISALLAESFSPDELLLWVEGLPDGRRLAAELYEHKAAPPVLFTRAAAALKWRLDAEVLYSVVALRPGTAESARRIAVAAGLALDEARLAALQAARASVEMDPGELALSVQLERTYERLESAHEQAGDIAAIEREILELRRKIRAGEVLRPGDFLSRGRYKLLERLGHGGFATVWRAWDRHRRRPCAIKVLHGQWAEDRSRRERFFRGARHMSALQHSHVVKVFEEQVREDSFHYFVMELVPGGDLREAVVSGRLDPRGGLSLLLQVGEALSYAHGRGVVHRDVKPHNVLITADGAAKLTDFDLVKAEGTTGGTGDGALGTFLYAAPEALNSGAEAGPRADVYSLAMTAVFCLSGKDLPVEALLDRDAFIRALDAPSGLRDALLRATTPKVESRIGVWALCEGIAAGLADLGWSEGRGAGTGEQGGGLATGPGRRLRWSRRIPKFRSFIFAFGLIGLPGLVVLSLVLVGRMMHIPAVWGGALLGGGLVLVVQFALARLMRR